MVDKKSGTTHSADPAHAWRPLFVRDLLLLGASAGGPAALAAILQRLPQDFPAAIILAQHVHSLYVPTLADFFARQSALPVRIAREGDLPKAGTILLADTKHHLVFKGGQYLGYTPHPADSPHPSIDALFQSATTIRCKRVAAVILTGMGRDGALGLKALRNAGAATIAQDSATSTVYGMPKAAAEMGGAGEVLPLSIIPQRLLSIFQSSTT